MMNKITRVVGITGLATLTAMASLGLGSMNVFADDAKLPIYVMDGTNAERAISDYFVNNFNKVNDGSVVIPHMDIMDTRDSGSEMDVYGAYQVVEYVQDGKALKEDGASFASFGRFTLNRNEDGTYAVGSFKEIPDDASKDDFVDVYGKGLSDEAFELYCHNDGEELWKDISAQDAAYYAYDNKLGLDKIEMRNGETVDFANVSFSTEGTHNMYVQKDANVRTAGTKKAAAFDGLCRGEKVAVTGMANGWGRISMNGRTGYISASLLGDKKPVKEEKKEEKKEKKEKKEVSTVETGYVVGRIESYSGSSVEICGVRASINSETALSGGEMRVGDVAKLEYSIKSDGSIVATSLHTNGDPMEGVAIASDGRVADTGDNYGRGYDEESVEVTVDGENEAVEIQDGSPAPEEVPAEESQDENQASEETVVNDAAEEEVFVEVE